MLDFLWNAASFVTTLGVLVTIHEFGHFWVARRLGVKVIRFSIGFGKALWRRTAEDGTEYVVAAIPLGGYVKMLDEREGDVPENEKHRAFNLKPVLSRIAIVGAGPAANFILAIFVYWWMFVLGVPALKPYLGDIPAQSIAANAGLENGDEIISIDGVNVGNWQEVNHAIIRRMGENGEINIAVRHLQDSIIRDYSLQLENWQIDPDQPDVLNSLGITPWHPSYPPKLGEVLPDEAAARAGLKEEDIIVRINQQSVDIWSDIVKVVSANPNTQMEVDVIRGTQEIKLNLLTGIIDRQGKKQGYLGVARPELSEKQLTRLKNMQYHQQYDFFEAIGKGIDKTWEITLLSFRLIGKIFNGEVSAKNLSGPITIAKGAGAYASYGFVYFLGFLGMISVNLGIINLLPIPVLDGGHLMYYIIEMIRGKPISEAVQEIGFRIGMILVLSLMVFSIVNDIGRL
ncbi:MAG: sigma E protease regulator RseP [Gammaproteobacteria bacterium]|nr:sigma E protease regulator RseP [Gammaproteobacteria bacterium]